VVVKAKKENFTEGWGQCLAELIACQYMNDGEYITLWESWTIFLVNVKSR